ncbi:unnamed protein product, partial [Rotaria magnacalcarata]
MSTSSASTTSVKKGSRSTIEQINPSDNPGGSNK